MILLLAGLFLSTIATAKANSLLGSSVTGTVQYEGSGPNFFDPALGFVPAGFLNSGGTTVSISDSATEFAVEDDLNLQTADFTAGQLIITDVSSGFAVSFRMTFQSQAFVGSTLTELSDSFLNGGATANLVGDTITVNVPEFTSAGTFSAVLAVTTPSTNVPEGGSTAGLLMIGLAGLVGIRAKTHRPLRGLS